MKTIGLIGGMSWESSAQYYSIINQEVRRRLGGAHSARILMASLDFGEVEAMQHAGEWDALGETMAATARSLHAGGADFLVLCTNTMHRLAAEIETATPLELLHIADPTASAVLAAGYRTVGLLGTAFTMEQDFYKGRLTDRFGLDVLVPDAEDRQLVHRVIYDELVAGVINEASRQAYRAVVERLAQRGAEAVILGCTEIMLLLQPQDSSLPLFDTTRLHALAAVDRALGD